MLLTEWLIVLTVSIIVAGGWWLAHRPPSPSQLEPMTRTWLADKNHHRAEH